MFFKKKKKILTQQEFLEMIKEKMLLSIEGLKVSYNSTYSLRMHYKNNEYVLNYSKEYENYLDNPESIEETFASIRAAFFSFVESPKVNSEIIFPRIENKLFIIEQQKRDVLAFNNIVYKQLNEELYVLFTHEHEGKIYPIQKSDLVDLDYSIEELWGKAANNVANLPNIKSHNTEGLYQITAGELYESSFILLDLLLRRQLDVSGKIVVAIPTRNSFFAAGSEDKDNLSKLRSIIENIKNEGNLMLSDKLFVLSDNNTFDTFVQKRDDIEGLLLEDEFAAIIIEKLNKRIEGLKIVSQDRLQIETEFRDQKIRYRYYKCYDEYTKHPEALEQILNSYLNVTYDTHMHIGVPIKTSKIFPIIRSKDALETLSESEPDFEKIIYYSYSDELLVFYIESRDNSLYFIRSSDMINLNYSLEDLKAKGIENLNADWNVTISGDEGLYDVSSKGKFASSLILLDVWKDEYFSLKGDLVVALPHPNLVYVTGSEDQTNLAIVRDAINRIKGDWYSGISDKLFVYRRKRFEVFE